MRGSLTTNNLPVGYASGFCLGIATYEPGGTRYRQSGVCCHLSTLKLAPPTSGGAFHFTALGRYAGGMQCNHYDASLVEGWGDHGGCHANRSGFSTLSARDGRAA